jgi:hypothetical protein
LAPAAGGGAVVVVLTVVVEATPVRRSSISRRSRTFNVSSARSSRWAEPIAQPVVALRLTQKIWLALPTEWGAGSRSIRAR